MSLFDFDFGELNEIAKPVFVEFHEQNDSVISPICFAKSVIVGFGDQFIILDEGGSEFSSFAVLENYEEISNILGVII